MKITIPVQPHILRFIQYLEELEDGDALDLQRNSFVSKLVKSILVMKSTYYDQYRNTNKTDKRLTAELPVIMTGSMEKYNAQFYTHESVYRINNQLCLLLDEWIIDRIRKSSNKRAIHVMAECLEDLGIEDMVDIDSIKKRIQRSRKTKKTLSQQQKKSLKRSPQIVPRL